MASSTAPVLTAAEMEQFSARSSGTIHGLNSVQDEFVFKPVAVDWQAMMAECARTGEPLFPKKFLEDWQLELREKVAEEAASVVWDFAFVSKEQLEDALAEDRKKLAELEAKEEQTRAEFEEVEWLKANIRAFSQELGWRASEDTVRALCAGCRDGELNQLGHVGPGGCLGDWDEL